MSALLQYFERTIKGMETYFSQDKMVVVLLLVLLLLWLGEKKHNSEANNRFLVYSAGMSLVLLVPFTAIFVVIYQSAFYDYEWAWSMVPIAAVVGYGGVLLYEQSEKDGKRKVGWWLALLILLFFCGNQGCLKTAASEEYRETASVREITNVIESVASTEKQILWGPGDVMQEVRRATGDIGLIYGKDMWDLKAGAYDYEAYSEEIIRAYEWMNTVSVLAAESHGADETALYEKYDIVGQFPEVFSSVAESGVNIIVLPKSASDKLEAVFFETAEDRNIDVQKEYAEQYVIYLLKQ